MYNGFIPAVFDAIESLIIPELGFLKAVQEIGDGIADLIENLSPDNISQLLIDLFCLLFDKVEGLSDMVKIVEMIQVGIFLEDLSKCEIEEGDYVVSYPICWNGTSTSDSMVVFSPQNKIKMIVLNDLVNHEQTVR